MFIVIEGLDGVGKTTTAKLLAQKENMTFLPWLQEPFRSAIKSIWGSKHPVSKNSEHMVFCGALKHLSDLVELHQSQGEYVVVDRYFFSSACVHGPLARKNGEHPLSIEFNRLNLLKPDYSFHLELDESERYRRLANRAESKSPTEILLEEDPIFYRGVVGNFKSQINSGDLVNVPITGCSPDQVVDKIIRHIQECRL